MTRELDIDEALLTDYVAGECTAAQRAAVERWVAADPERRRRLERVRRVWDAARTLPGPALDVEAMSGALREFVGRVPDGAKRHETYGTAVGGYSRLWSLRGRSSLGKQTLPQDGALGKRTLRGTLLSRKSIFSPLSIGMLTLLILGGGIVLSRKEPVPNAIQRYQTASGQRSTVRLSDGSVMTLAPSTTVVVTPSAAEVSGEAYFTMTPNPRRPFIVRTGNAVAQVLGTRFSVRQYVQEDASRIVVEDGRVAVRAPSRHARPTVLSAWMVAHVTDSGIVVQGGTPAHDDIAWTRGQLVFNAIPLRDVVQELSRAYGTGIRLTDSVLIRQRITFTVSIRDVPLTEILNQLAFMANAHVTREGAAFVILPGRSAIPQRPTVKRFPTLEKEYGR